MTKNNLILITILVVAAELLGLLFQHQAQARLRGEIYALQPAASDLPALLAENQRLSNNLSASSNAQSNLASQLDELSRLQAKVTAQNQQLQELQTELAAQPDLPPFQSLAGSNRFVNLPRESWHSAGYNTPEAALETMLWATVNGDVNTLRASLTSDELNRRQNAWKGKTDDEIADTGMKNLGQSSGLQILNLQMSSENSAHFTLYVSGLPHPDQPLWLDVIRINGEWKSDRSIGW